MILLGANIATRDQVSALTRALRAAAKAGGRPTPLLMVDQEGGDVRRLPWASPRTSARGLARLPLDAVEREGAATARELLARGLNVNLAPVVDVKADAANFLGSRTFAADARAVARNACRFAAGLRRGGVAPTLKHFRGSARRAPRTRTSQPWRSGARSPRCGATGCPIGPAVAWAGR